MCTPKDVLDPSVDGQISYLCGRHDCSLLHFGDPVIGTVYDDRILVSSGQWWPLPRGYPPTPMPPRITPSCIITSPPCPNVSWGSPNSLMLLPWLCSRWAW